MTIYVCDFAACYGNFQSHFLIAYELETISYCQYLRAYSGLSRDMIREDGVRFGRIWILDDRGVLGELVLCRTVVLDKCITNRSIHPVLLRDYILVGQVVLRSPLLIYWAKRRGRDVEPKFILDFISLEKGPSRISVDIRIYNPPH